MENIDSGKITILTALDISAAFDTLDHATLLHKLEHTFCLSGFVISWLSHICFLAHLLLNLIRRHSSLPPYSQAYPKALFCVHFFLFFSSHRLQTSLILARPVTICFFFHQYADDTQLYIGANSSSLVSQIASIESCALRVRVHDWLLNNGLHLNPSKSETITFSNPRSKPLQTLAESIGFISVAGSPIKLQTSIKNLGVYLDSRLSFDKQVSEICKASYFHIRVLRHIRSSLTTEAAKTKASAIYSWITTWLLQLLEAGQVGNYRCASLAHL